MAKIARLLGLVFLNENPEAVLIHNSDCSHWSGLTLNLLQGLKLLNPAL